MSNIRKATRGMVAGFMATGPMTAAMALLYQRLPAWQQYPLPPEPITVEMAERVDLEEQVDEEAERSVATGLGHFAYGAAGGAVYTLTMERVPLPPVLKGVLFGSVFWAFGYLGWLPTFDILPPATEQPRQRTWLMIVAHQVYGVATALLLAPLEGER